MVTAEEIGQVAVFADLGLAERDRLARVVADITLVPGESAVNEGDARALFGVLEGRIEVFRLVDGEQSVIGERRPGEIFGEMSIALWDASPRRVPGRGAVARVSGRVARLPGADRRRARCRGAGRGVGQPPTRRAQGPAGPCIRTVTGPGDRSRPPLGRVLRGFAALPRSQPGSLQLASARCAVPIWSSGGSPLPAEDDYPAIRVVNGETVVRPSLRRVAELLDIADRADGRGVRHGDRRRGTCRTGSCGVRRVRGAANDRGRARGARRPGGHVLADRELPRLSLGRVGRRAVEPGAPAGAQARGRDPRDAVDHADRCRRRVRSTSTAATSLRARTIILACGVSWRRLGDRGVRPARRQGHLLRRRAQRSSEHARARRPHRRRRQLGGAGGDVLRQPTPGRVTILCRGDTLEKSMSQLSRSTSSRPGANIRRPVPTPRSSAAHGDASLEAIDVHDAATRRDDAARVGRPVHLHRRRRRDRRGSRRRSRSTARATCSPARTCATPDAWQLERDPYLLETSVPGIFACGDVRFSPVKRVAAAVGEGSMAIAFVHQYLRDA